MSAPMLQARSAPSPHSPSKTGVNALLLGEGRGGGLATNPDSLNQDSRPTPTPDPSPQGGGGRVAGREVEIAGVVVVADPSGTLYWPAERLLVVADLHLEKGSSYAARGVLLPPYDTAATLARLAQVMARYAPRAVIALGDSFHDGGGPDRVLNGDRTTLLQLQRGRDWIWIAGNHDPEPTAGVGGTSAAALVIGALMFRHEPQPHAEAGEVAGH